MIIVNNHLETTGLSNEDKREFKSLVKGDLKVTAAKQTSYRLVDKLGDASAKASGSG